MVGKKIQDKILVIITFFIVSLGMYSCGPVGGEILPPDPDEEIIEPTWLNVLDFGAVDDIDTYSTYGIQAAVDSAVRQGGGTVYVPQGSYLTAPIQLKSNVTIHLAEGAVIYGSTEILKYNMSSERALIYARDQKNIAIEGKGTIDGRGKALAMNVIEMVATGIINESQATIESIKTKLASGWDFYANPFPRPDEKFRPMLVRFDKCIGVRLEDSTFKHACCWTISLHGCSDIYVQRIKVISTAYWNNDGIDLNDCKNAIVKNSDFDSADDGICLKSHVVDGCENILVDSCKVRSSASAVKFGTSSRGGFRNITITNITVYNTFRSAIALEAVDGGGLENIYVGNINATKTGNAIFMVVGTRGGGNNSYMKNVVIENLKCEVPATKHPDEGYPIPGPVPGFKHNIFPSTITGHKDSRIEDVTLRNIEIVFSGGGLASTAFCDVAMLDTQMDGKYGSYPEFSMFGELPAWGILTRYVNNISMENIRLILKTADYRNAFVFDKCDAVNLKDITVSRDTKTPLIFNKTTNKEISGVSAPENSSGKLYEEYNY